MHPKKQRNFQSRFQNVIDVCNDDVFKALKNRDIYNYIYNKRKKATLTAKHKRFHC